MREFKFIRGKYTDENIFNSDETDACLFAYDEAGNLISFNEKNDKDFQDKFVELSSSDRLSEIYTLRPSQFNISAKQESAGHYSYTFKANEKVYDGSTQFPSKVITNAETRIKAHTSALFNTTSELPILNLSGDEEKNTLTTFTFNNEKTFKRNLVFKVSGFLKERGYVAASGENIDAYRTADGKIDYDSGIVKGTFYSGRLQKEAQSIEKTIISSKLTVGENTTLSVASKYSPAEGYTFIYGEGTGKQFANEINYGDSSTFDLYKILTQYLETSDADHAVTISNAFESDGQKYTLGSDNKFVAFDAAPVTGTTYYEAGSSSDHIYASKVNNLPDEKLNTESIKFVSGNAITVLPVDTLFDRANNSSATTDVLFNTITVQEGQLAYAKIGEQWTRVDVGNDVDVSFSLDGTDGTLTSFIKEGTALKASVGNTVYDVTSEDRVSCTMTYNNAVVSKFKYFDTLTQNKYVVTANISEYLENTEEPSDFIEMKVSEIGISYSLNEDYVAYTTGTSLNTVYDRSLHTYYEVATNNIIDISSTNYNFYHKVQANAYILKNSFTVPAYNVNTIINGYGDSYSGYYIRDGNRLRSLEESDLTESSISVYTRSDYHLFTEGVYEDDDSNTTNYVMLSGDDWVEGITISKDNASVRNSDNTISPIITNSVIRLITSVDVEATQSD